MVPVAEYFRSVEHVWLLWLVAVAGLAVLTIRLLRGCRWGDWKALLLEEDGAAYSLSYVLTFPFYLYFVCLVIETTMFLVVKTGTVYAAYAGARANIVWRTTPARPGDAGDRDALRREADRRTQQAAVNAMAAFASSSSLHARGAGVVGTSSPEARAFVEAYRRYDPGGSATPSYLAAKYRFAEKATAVVITPDDPAADGDITVTVTYEMPLHIPGIGRILGQRPSWPGARFRTVLVSSSATLQNEAPKNRRQSVGINYVSQ